MSKVTGYIVRLNSHRQKVFNETYAGLFAEPVPEFEHSRNVPLVCFFINGVDQITHISLGKRGMKAGTDLRRLNFSEIEPLNNQISCLSILSIISTRPKGVLEKIFQSGGILTPLNFQELIRAIIQLEPDMKPKLAKYSDARIKRIADLSEKSKTNLAEQKEAIITALSIAGHDRSQLLAWDFEEKSKPESFLDGLGQIKLREDTMIINDQMKFPGYEILKTTPHSSVVFKNEKSTLTVILANRQPLEELFGTDLIYYNETFKCFIMVQYKALEKEGDEKVFRLPNNQMDIEIKRMKMILEMLKKCSPDDTADGYRFSDNPFFLKMCTRIVFNPDDVGLVPGMYIPLDYWILLDGSSDLSGPKGGKFLSYNNVRRYFDNTAFATIVSGGWVGSTIKQSIVLEELIKSTLESGRAAVLAINKMSDMKYSK